jgi:hypothetical protein
MQNSARWRGSGGVGRVFLGAESWESEVFEPTGD